MNPPPHPLGIAAGNRGWFHRVSSTLASTLASTLTWLGSVTYLAAGLALALLLSASARASSATPVSSAAMELQRPRAYSDSTLLSRKLIHLAVPPTCGPSVSRRGDATGKRRSAYGPCGLIDPSGRRWI